MVLQIVAGWLLKVLVEIKCFNDCPSLNLESPCIFKDIVLISTSLDFITSSSSHFRIAFREHNLEVLPGWICLIHFNSEAFFLLLLGEIWAQDDRILLFKSLVDSLVFFLTLFIGFVFTDEVLTGAWSCLNSLPILYFLSWILLFMVYFHLFKPYVNLGVEVFIQYNWLMRVVFVKVSLVPVLTMLRNGGKLEEYDLLELLVANNP